MSDLAGKFIVLDGVEGCGKSTQEWLLREHLSARGQAVVVTCEPGATPIGKRLRDLLLREQAAMTPLTETFLFCADRAEHVAQVIAPALAAGKWVICDRFSSSTAAYQGWAGKVGLEIFLALDAPARLALSQVPGREDSEGHPDLTIILDLEPQQGLTRKGVAPVSPTAGDNFEQRSLSFHRRVREGFLKYAELSGPRAVVIDADRPIDEVQRAILAAVGLSD